MRKSIYLVLVSCLGLVYLSGGGCSSNSVVDSSSSGSQAASAGATSSSSGNPPASMVVSINPSSGLSALGTATVSATVRDSAGAAVADGTTVSFTVSNSALGSITPTATTVSGVANATFTADNTAGTVGITVTTGTGVDAISASGSITIIGADLGSIQFTSATPTVIGVKGSGQAESAVVIFTVRDKNGQLAPDGTSVTFSIAGPNGGESINPTTASTVGGVAQTTLQSGSVPGPVNFTATVTTATGAILKSSPTPVSIGGGVPSATHFNLATTRFNLPGLVTSNSQATITAFIADRYGNFNVLTGTSISFYAEAGAIDRSDQTDATGIASVSFRTQAPMPADVGISASEVTMINAVNAAYGLAIANDGSDPHPRDGWVTVLATVQGEEAFNDANANGVYDTGESFTDLGEPFVDKNNDGCWNSGTTRNCNGVVSASTDPFEVFIDTNGNGVYDPPNGVWDGPGCAGASCQTVKTIWTSIVLAFTGNASYCQLAGNMTVADGATNSYSFMVSDIDLNRLVPGTTISVAATGGGTLGGQTSYTVPDGVPSGPTTISFTLSDASAGDTNPPAASSITVTVASSEVVGCVVTRSGTID